MKYLRFFEGVEDTQMGITTDEIQECFYDLIDEGWIVNVRFAKKLSNAKIDREKGGMIMDLIPYLQIKIHKEHVNKFTHTRMIELELSAPYKECVSKLRDRLDEHNLVVVNNPKYNSHIGQIEQLPNGGFEIFILIYRKSDENYKSIC